MGHPERRSLRTTAGNPVTCSVAWQEKLYATRQPEPAEWVEHWPEWRVSADSPVHVAVLLDVEGRVRFGRLPALAPSHEVRIDLKLTRYREEWPGWPAEKLVHVSLHQNSGEAGDGLRTLVVSEHLWLDPREGVNAFRPDDLSTGTWFELARADEVALTASAVVLSADEVRIVKGRWRAKTDVIDAIPAELAFLAHGRRAGEASPVR